MHIVITDLPGDALARTLTVDELLGARVISAQDALEHPELMDTAGLEQLRAVSENVFGGFSPLVTAALAAIQPGQIPPHAKLHVVYHGGMTEQEGDTARETAHAWAAHLGFADCAVSLRTQTFLDIAAPKAFDRPPHRAAWLLGASGQDGAAAGRAMRIVSRMSRLHGAHTLLCGDSALTPAEMQPFAAADAVVIGFSLYNDQIPAYMLSHLKALAQQKNDSRRRLYALVCAAGAQKPGSLALARLEHFALRAGMAWGQGLVIAAKSLPASPGDSVTRAVQAALHLMAVTLTRGQRARNTWVTARLPRLIRRGRNYPVPGAVNPSMLKG